METSEFESPVNVELYQEIIGSLTYVTTTTSLDISKAVNMLVKYIWKPVKEQIDGLKRIFRYLKGTVDYGLMLTAKDDIYLLYVYSDSNWAGDVDKRNSFLISGYVFKFMEIL